MSDILTLNGIFPGNLHFVFLGGIHGVGKSTFCRDFFYPLGYKCVTASSLIRKHGLSSDVNKRVAKVGENQLALMDQLIIEREHNDWLLLDGHYCVINAQHELETIGIEVFQKINPDVLLLLFGSPEEVVSRLKERDSQSWSVQFVRKFQDTEVRHAKFISEELGIPLYIFSSDILKTVRQE